MSEAKKSKHEQGQWVQGLARFLDKTDHAKAALWDDAQTEVSIATIGEVDERALRRLLEETLADPWVGRNDGESAGATPAGYRIRTLPGQTLIEKEAVCISGTRLWRWRKLPWPDPAEALKHRDEEAEEDWRVLAGLAATCGFLGLSAFSIQMSGVGPDWLAPALYILSMLFGGLDAARDALPKLFRGELDIHFLMLAVAVGASLIGAYGEGALLLFLFSLAGSLEHFALHRTRREINALFRAAPKQATIRDETSGEERSVAVDAVRTGDIVVIRPGDTFPTDGELLIGATAVDESSLTGEANAVDKQVGDEVFSGTNNLWGAVDVRCLRPANASALQKIIELIQRAQHMRAPSQRFTDRFGPAYTVGVLTVTLLMFFVWWLGLGIAPFQNLSEDGRIQFSAFYRAMTLLVVASPCALVLSIPSAILAAIANGARRGILFRGGAAIEKLADVDVVALDKTGTLTTGDLEVASVESFPPGKEAKIAELAYALEVKANHPLARAIARHGKAKGYRPLPLENFRSITGKGVQATIDGATCLLGSRACFAGGPLSEWAEDLPEAPPEFTEVWLVSEALVGRLLLRDEIRFESAGVLDALRKLAIHTVMLTGDRRSTAQAVGTQLGISEIRAGLSPEGKVEAVRGFTEGGHRVAMIGDGINDAPCLAAAHVSVAMGARGSDAALEQSEVVLMKDKIENFLAAFQLSRRARRIIRQNLVLALGTMGVMVAAAVFGLVPISLGVLAHEGSTVLVCLNSMRLLRG